MANVTKWLKYHVVDTTALLTSTNPIYSASEVWIAGMSDQVSIDSRLTVAGISYAGMGFAFARGRDLSRRIFKITGETKEKIQVFHDMAFTSAFNLAIAPLIYLSMGADLKQAAIGGLSAAVLSIGMGPIMGYSIDVGRDLTGLGNCERRTYPDLVRRRNPKVKKGLAALLVAASIGLIAGIYSLTPDKQDSQIPKTSVAQVLENSEQNSLLEQKILEEN
ncbi:MAG: L-alanine exporter AlaE [Candidatus Woesearchaeota archaeon]